MDADVDVLDRLRGVVPMGGAICLVGAGFSVAATDQKGKAVPNSYELIQELKAVIGIDAAEEASLADIADFCDNNPKTQQALRGVLINRLTHCNPNGAQKSAIKRPWRSVFTTNFDDTLERCLPDGSYQMITPTSNSTHRIQGKLPLYYLHGRAKDLVESDKSPQLVISERNYLTLREENREIYTELKNELFCAKLIVIVGYSMRDLDIARALIEPGYAFHSKTIIICDPKEKQLSISRLSKFGHVLAIGLDGLVAKLESTNIISAVTRSSLHFVDDFKRIEAATEIEGDDFVKLILTGNFSHAKYQAQIRQEKHPSELYCVRRSKALDILVKRPNDGCNRFIISSDIGNGKSIFLEQLTIELIEAGYRVIRISSGLNEVFPELESALSTDEPTAFLIDDVIRYRNVAKFVGVRLNAHGLLVCCMRADTDDIQFKQLSNDLSGVVRQVDLNLLSSEELLSWDRLLERWGFWGQRISLSPAQRLEFLAKKCGAENRSIVLSLFRISQIATRIDQIVTFFLGNVAHRKAFAALLISSLCQQHVSWESLVSWIGFDEQNLREDIRKSKISDLFSSGRAWNMLTSSQLAEYIIRYKYITEHKDTLVDVYSTIVIGTAESASSDYLGANFRENLKELVKFRFLTRLLGDDTEAVNLIGLVYKRLSTAARIRKNPQFWLQYAMSRMEVNDLVNAEFYLETAMGLAKERGLNYSPHQILDQRARLYLRKSSVTKGKFKAAEIKLAVNDLDNLLSNRANEIVYIFRSVPLILSFVEVQIDDLDKELRVTIQNLLEKIKAAGENYLRLPRSQNGETERLKKTMNTVLFVLRNA